MIATPSVRFDVRPWGGGSNPARELLAFVDGVSMVDLVGAYELSAGFDVPGQYAGLVLDHFGFGDLASYLIGEPDSAYFPDRGTIAVLGCDCGEVGCWPLQARVLVDDAAVTWLGFAQPFRPHRDYSAFGPFVFERAQYEHAVQQAVADSA